MITKYTIDRHFNRFCKAMYNDQQTETPFAAWKQNNIENLKKSFDIIQQDAKLHTIQNTYKQPKP